MTPEFSRPVAVARIGEATSFPVEADEAERAAVAERMRLPEVRALRCAYTLRRATGQTVLAHGSLRAVVVQACVVTLDLFEAEVAEDFDVRFVPEERLSEGVDVDAEDEIPYTGGTIDLGEAASEQLALALDPFPRRPGVDFTDGEPQDVARSPFDALARRRLS